MPARSAAPPAPWRCQLPPPSPPTRGWSRRAAVGSRGGAGAGEGQGVGGECEVLGRKNNAEQGLTRVGSSLGEGRRHSGRHPCSHLPLRPRLLQCGRQAKQPAAHRQLAVNGALADHAVGGCAGQCVVRAEGGHLRGGRRGAELARSAVRLGRCTRRHSVWGGEQCPRQGSS